MTEASPFLTRWQNLRRHPAFQVAAVYAGASWALIQVADIFFPSLNVVRWLGIALIIGFLPVVGIAWWLADRGTESGSAEAAGGEAGAAARTGRRRRRYAYTAAVALLLLGGVFWWIRPNILGAVAPDAQVIAVLPFSVSGPGVELLGEGMVDLISANLDDVGGIRTIDSRTVLHRWGQRALDGTLDLGGALAVGRDVEAGSIVWGRVVSVGPEVVLSAHIYSVRGAELAEGRAEGHADSVLALVDSLSLNLLRKIWVAREPVPNLRVSGITTGSVEAIRSYLNGMKHYRRSAWDSARASFGSAIEADSTFALAHFQLAITYGWSPGHGYGSAGAKEHGAAALRFADRLPARERSLVAANNLFEMGSVAAHDSMVKFVARYPDDVDGWYELADIRFHSFPLLALEREDLFGPFDRVVELDPSLAPALIHPLELSMAYADTAAFAKYLAKLEDAAQPAEAVRFRVAGRVMTHPDSMGVLLQTRPEAVRYAGYLLTGAYRADAAYLQQLATAMGEAAHLEADSRDRDDILQVAGMVLASLGRLEEAKEVYDTLWAIAPNTQAPYTSVLPVLAGYADSSFAAAALASLSNPPPLPGLDQLFEYNRMLVALSRGESSEARQLAEAALAADTSLFPEIVPPLIRAGLGWADVIDGDTLGGLAAMEAALQEAGYASGLIFFLNAPLRFSFAAIQATQPATRAEAIRRLRDGWWFGDFVYFPTSYLVLGQALEAEGDSAGAARAYAQFLELWERADPELQPRVESARRALQRLTGEKLN